VLFQRFFFNAKPGKCGPSPFGLVSAAQGVRSLGVRTGRQRPGLQRPGGRWLLAAQCRLSAEGANLPSSHARGLQAGAPFNRFGSGESTV